MEALLGVALVFAGAAAGAGILGGGLYLILRAAARHQERIDRIWQGVAARHGWTFQPARYAFLDSRSRSLEAVVRSACVYVDTYTVSSGKNSTTYTRARAEYVMPYGPGFRVYREHILSPLGKALGFQDIEMADPAFDDAFVVKGEYEQAVRSAWTEEARGRMCALHADAGVHSDGCVLTMRWNGVEKDPEKLESAILLIAALARSGVAHLERLCELPGARWVDPSGSWDARTSPAVELEAAGARVYVRPTVFEHHLVLCVEAEGTRRVPPYRVRIGDDGQVEGELPEGALAGDARTLLRAAAGCSLTWDGRVARLHFGPRDRADLVAARARLVSELAQGGVRQGAFR